MTTSDSSFPIRVPPLRADTASLSFSEQPLTCSVSSEDMYRVIDGYVERSQGFDLADHIDDCDCCSDVYRFQLGLRSVIGIGCREELPADVRQRILDSLTQLD